VNPFVQPNDSTLNWYGSGDVNNDNIVNGQDLTRLNELIAGTYSNPNDIRLNDRADVNGDEIVNSNDLELLAKKRNGVILYLPGEWNKLPTHAEREDWLKKMLAIDKTNNMPYIPEEFVCTGFASQTMLNFHGFGDLGYDESKGLKDNGRFNIPMYYVSVGAPGFGHAINTTIVGDNVESFNDGFYTEPQNDSHVVPGMQSMPNDCEVTINYTYVLNSLSQGKILDGIPILKFQITNGIPSFTWKNPDTNLNIITQRGK
ncbi:MAG: dockerin type I repeat-containing protein, partial [Nanoarchaeota archaeon]